MIRTARPYALAVALLATIFAATAIWASTPPGPAAATPTNILGTDGRYTLLFLGSDKRCGGALRDKTAERCGEGVLNATDWTWSPANDKAAGVPRDQLGSERTDVIMLLTVDPFSGQTAAYSIPRDLYGFPLKPALAKSFCRAGSKIFTDKINAMIVRAQQCARSNMTATQRAAWDKKLAWERSIVAADLMTQNLAWGLGIEIDDWTLTTFGTSDILASNAMYGDLLFLRPGRADNYPSSKVIGWSHANCKEPGTTKTIRTTSPYFVEGSCDTTIPLSAATNESCAFRVPSTLWTGFGRARKYDDVGPRSLRHQRLVAGITLRVLEANRFRAATLASMMNLRWYKKGPPLVRGTITAANVEAIFNVIEFAKPALELGPDVAGGWKSLLMTGGTDSVKKCALAGAKMRFAPTAATLASTISCTKAWLAPYFGPVADHLNEGPPVAP
ncbi:MAG: hypothetical protein EBR48_02755 [bacterium]|nr:hypothetical protein [Candidatus Aquidulcis frankliniae]